MRVFSYSKAVAKRGRPKISRPFKCWLYNPRRGDDQAFLLSEKKRIYLVQGEGVPRCSAATIEEKAFEKYAPLRDLSLLMLVKIRKLEHDEKAKNMHIVCDFYDYHERTLARNRDLYIPSVYEDIDELWAALKNFEEVPEDRLSLNKEHQELLDAKEHAALRSPLHWDLVFSVVAVVMGLFFARYFFFFALFAGVKAGFDFKKIVKSPFATTKSSAYCLVASLICDAVSLFFVLSV